MKTLKIIFFLSLVFVFSGKSEAQTDAGKSYRVIAYNVNGTQLTSMSNVAVAHPKPLVYVPNTFTPNDDGMNDFFKVEGTGLGHFSMEIFNRWGERVFASEDMNVSWDGTYKGEKIKSTDVFVYKLITQGKYTGEYLEKEGRVTLLAEGINE